jgi:amino-acid N-acetyltransferase
VTSARNALRLASPGDIGAITEILDGAGLTLNGVEEHLDSFCVAVTEGRVEGCAGLEIYASAALLRSVAVRPEARAMGWGRALCDLQLEIAREAGVLEVFLLTTTAEAFFRRLGFSIVTRDAAPPAIQGTDEFASLCPASAAFMSRLIASRPGAT